MIFHSLFFANFDFPDRLFRVKQFPRVLASLESWAEISETPSAYCPSSKGTQYQNLAHLLDDRGAESFFQPLRSPAHYDVVIPLE